MSSFDAITPLLIPQESRGWQKYFRLNLPLGASFFLRHREALIPSDYGPFRQENVSCFDGDLSSQGMLIVGATQPGKYLLVGALRAHRSLTYFSLHVRQKRLEGLTVYQPDMPADGEGEPLVVLEGLDWRHLLLEYAERVRVDANPRCSLPSPSVGYCTWYYSYQQITEAGFFQNLETLASHRARFPVRVVQIDDGYQAHHGDWLTTGPDWPSSLATIAGRISAAGFVPGIWTMPLLASTASRIFHEHPDWFVHGRDGELVVIPGWSPKPDDKWVCLDASRNDVQRHLRDVFSCLYECGFRYFKLDGLGLSYPDGLREDGQATCISALRTGMQVIREAVHDSTVLSCGGPFLPSVGLADQARMSGDTGTRWKAVGIPGEGVPRNTRPWEDQDPTIPCLFNALRQTLQNWWMFDRWFLADPDVVMARDENTRLTAGEARLSALAAVLTGVVFTSDDLGKMAPERLSLLERVARLRMVDAFPIRDGADYTLFSGKIGTSSALAVFNWSEEPLLLDLRSLGLSNPAMEWLNPASSFPTLAGHDAALFQTI